MTHLSSGSIFLIIFTSRLFHVNISLIQLMIIMWLLYYRPRPSDQTALDRPRCTFWRWNNRLCKFPAEHKAEFGKLKTPSFCIALNNMLMTLFVIVHKYYIHYILKNTTVICFIGLYFMFRVWTSCLLEDLVNSGDNVPIPMC